MERCSHESPQRLWFAQGYASEPLMLGISLSWSTAGCQSIPLCISSPQSAGLIEGFFLVRTKSNTLPVAVYTLHNSCSHFSMSIAVSVKSSTELFKKHTRVRHINCLLFGLWMKVTKLSDKVWHKESINRHGTLFIIVLNIMQVLKFNVNVLSCPKHGRWFWKEILYQNNFWLFLVQ